MFASIFCIVNQFLQAVVNYNMYTLISMRRDQLLVLLTAMGQHTTKKGQLQ